MLIDVCGPVHLVHVQSSVTDISFSDLFPEGLIEETIRTLSLLLPLNTRESTAWFLKQQIEYHLDGEAVRCRSLMKEERNIDSFA